jgi:hypothetical protein
LVCGFAQALWPHSFQDENPGRGNRTKAQSIGGHQTWCFIMLKSKNAGGGDDD